MSAPIPPTPPSPGVGLRRKGPKSLPKLPLSAFTPPNSGTSDKFPLPASPSTIHPESVIDANVVPGHGALDLSKWKQEASQSEILRDRIGGLVVVLPKADQETLSKVMETKSVAPFLSVVVPFDLDATEPPSLPILSSSPVPISLSTAFTKSSPEAVKNLRWALQQGRPVDIDIRTDLTDPVFESLEDLLAKSTADLPSVPPIVLSNLLPPPHNLELPIVKLMNHPIYRTFQAQIAALSLIPQIYIKYLQPCWDAPTPPTPSVANPPAEITGVKQKNEWKRRIKMYFGPVMEAFGYQRIIFGSSPSSIAQSKSAVWSWYELARESLAELAVEQEAVDAVFYTTAKKVYS
ncbi:hypothetical protein K435DRAFT_775568 [Dendrothele bispora CBS 962.96]|uniref:Amidohydrolase-related domain-containing protein n=1 Tax=Dendrothele bispora (strain CBS 962.96) TaxID=1314807 RepID=A0A4S8MI18_DENBC|nr:hypothetical protein K435DRAFT_775568 [Dendrothele bispora CBS 962.96]